MYFAIATCGHIFHQDTTGIILLPNALVFGMLLPGFVCIYVLASLAWNMLGLIHRIRCLNLTDHSSVCFYLLFISTSTLAN